MAQARGHLPASCVKARRETSRIFFRPDPAAHLAQPVRAPLSSWSAAGRPDLGFGRYGGRLGAWKAAGGAGRGMGPDPVLAAMCRSTHPARVVLSAAGDDEALRRPVPRGSTEPGSGVGPVRCVTGGQDRVAAG